MAKQLKSLTGLNPLAYLGVEATRPAQQVSSTRNPTSGLDGDYRGFNLGDEWINTSSDQVWKFMGLSAPRTPLWIEMASTSGVGTSTFNTDTSGPATDLLGVITMAGGSNITTDGSVANTVTFDLDDDVSVSGSLTAGTTITATAGDITADAGDIVATAGNVVVTSGNVELPETSASTDGVITIGGINFLHAYGDSPSTNTFLGLGAGNFSLTLLSAIHNTAIGLNALNAVTDGYYNTAIGSNSLTDVTTGTSNVGLGRSTGFTVTTGASNTFLGDAAGGTITTGSYNIIIGGSAGSNYASTEASNILISNAGVAAESNKIRIGTTGVGAGQQDTCYLAGTVVADTGVTATTGNITASSGNLVTSTGTVDLPSTTSSIAGVIRINSINFAHRFGTASTFIGSASGNFSLTGINNTALGTSTLSSVTTANFNVAIGSNALTTLSTGGGNIAIGNDALTVFDGGNSNIAIGGSARSTATTGERNIGIGESALAGAEGDQNVALGGSAGNSLSTGSYNTLIGDSAGSILTTGSYNICIGNTAGLSYATSDSSNIAINSSGNGGDSNILRIGAATGSGDQQLAKSFIHGIRGVTTDNADAIAVLIDSAGQLGTVSSSRIYKENITEMRGQSAAIMSLKPVTFNYKSDSRKTKQYGLIAEDVHDVMPELVVYDKEGHPETVKYHLLTSLLLNELQRLSERVTMLENSK